MSKQSCSLLAHKTLEQAVSLLVCVAHEQAVSLLACVAHGQVASLLAHRTLEQAVSLLVCVAHGQVGSLLVYRTLERAVSLLVHGQATCLLVGGLLDKWLVSLTTDHCSTFTQLMGNTAAAVATKGVDC